jgi:hypothetical protein
VSTSADTTGPRISAWITPVRLVLVIALLVFLVPLLSPIAQGRVVPAVLLPLAYLALVLTTWVVVSRVRHEPGSLLGRRGIRRALVAALVVVCAALLALPTPTLGTEDRLGPILLFVMLLALLNVSLGLATQRVATAPDAAVDEREEALRNRAHHLAYGVLAAVIAALLAADVATPASRSWFEGAIGGVGWIVIAELLFVLPAMMVAILEPSRAAPDDGEIAGAVAHKAKGRLAITLLALTFALPLLLSVSVVTAPLQVTSSVGALTTAQSVTGSSQWCRSFSAHTSAGWGVAADLPISAQACGNGVKAQEGWGMNKDDCDMGSGLLVAVTVDRCTRVVDASGTLHFTYTTTASPVLLPFLSRRVTLEIVVDASGHVERFP